MISAKSGKKELNFELNLLPVFDILSCCICFLLMTVVWIQIGSMNVNQAMGDHSSSSNDETPALWTYLNPNGEIVMSVKNTSVRGLSQMTLRGDSGNINWSSLKSNIAQVHGAIPDLKMALVMPSSKIPYQDIIHVMDELKQAGLSDVGISPL